MVGCIACASVFVEEKLRVGNVVGYRTYDFLRQTSPKEKKCIGKVLCTSIRSRGAAARRPCSTDEMMLLVRLVAGCIAEDRVPEQDATSKER